MKGIQSVDEEVITSLERVAETYPDRTALIYLGEKLSYAALTDRIYRFATALHELGVKDNDKVLLYIPNCPQWIIAYYAIQKIGGVVVPTSPIYTPYEISYQIEDSGAETIVCQDTNFGYVSKVFAGSPLKRIIVTNLVDMLPWWKRAAGRILDRVPRGSVIKNENLYGFRDLLKKYPPTPPKVDIDPQKHLAYILYTGGTTGKPKGVPGTHSGMVSYIKDMYDVTDGFVSEGEDVFVMVNPLFHIMAEMMIMGTALTVGNPTVLMPQPIVDAILEAIQRYRATLLLGAPALFRMILENDRLDRYDLSSLKYFWSGGDVLPEEIFNRFKKLTGRPIFQVYGSTETGGLTLSPMGKEPSPRSLGKPFVSREVLIVDPDTLEPVPVGKTGELLVTSPYLMDYWENPEETERAFVTLNNRKWYRMGDYVKMDESGELYYIDRKADVIKYKGYRVSASEIEAILQDHEAVIGACVVGVPDAKAGERIKAIVVTKEDVRGVGATDLIKWCRERLAPYKVPQYIEFRDMLPKSKVGKLLRREVREEERRRKDKDRGNQGSNTASS
ncbi:MAG: AMP-binding protein [Deltaproteobacteria bacterium]|nr:AMP-binding protein [Deltaproteobacteria bacterium]MBW1942066.1 AMP-binding protein [Deltaproteobacteria bacterium]MBW2207372.1 AMP-binding protein [Deltaproteobacteria bacterium]